MWFYSFALIDNIKTKKSSIRHSFHFALKKNEDQKRETKRKGKMKRGGNRDKEIVVSECIVLLSRFSRTHPYRI